MGADSVLNIELEILKRKHRDISKIHDKLIAHNINDKDTEFWKEELIKLEKQIKGSYGNCKQETWNN